MTAYRMQKWSLVLLASIWLAGDLILSPHNLTLLTGVIFVCMGVVFLVLNLPRKISQADRRASVRTLLIQLSVIASSIYVIGDGVITIDRWMYQ